MLLSLKWLREFVPFEGTAQELGDRLTMAGLEMDGLVKPYAGLSPLVVGHVVECGKHPEADKLSVCKVDVGDEVLDIVCGAPNVAQGQKVAVVKVGSTLPNGLTIKKAKLRGAPSHGMICSEAELGLSEEHDGILVLDASAPVGARLVDVLGLDDEVLDISITPNRGDCLSVFGFAREVSALYGLPLHMPQVTLQESGSPVDSELSLEIADPAMCPLYMGRILENASTERSPAWMRYRLHGIGVRAISNLVDVTNYILMELGQPLHAFDLDAVRGGKIRVCGADANEELVTLDGQSRTLLTSDITIRDAERAIGLGGVMGGLNSEISTTSKRVFLECAIFNPSHIRKTARRLALHSEAAYRFERGVDQTGAPYALERAAALMADVSGASVRPGILKAEPRPWHAPSITLRKKKVTALIGASFDDAFCSGSLTGLGCGVTELGGDGEERSWSVSVPGHRPDLTREVDLIEEIVRMYGVDRIEPVVPAISRPLERAGRPETAYAFRSRIKHWAKGLGLNEAINYSFVSHKELDVFEPERVDAPGRMSIMNPLSDEQNVLRTVLAPGMMNTLRNNLSQGIAGVRLFEVANAFFADAASVTTAREEQRLGLLAYGSRFDGSWPQVQADADYLDIKGIIEHLLRVLHMPAAVFTTQEHPGLSWLAPCVAITVNGRNIGFAGQVRSAVADAYHAKKAVWLAELDLDVLYEMHLAVRVAFAPLPVFPPVRRDMTVICGRGMTHATVENAIRDMRVALLADISLIDCFEPKDSDERNLTYRLTFRNAQRTLKDEEADKQRDAIAAALVKALPVRI